MAYSTSTPVLDGNTIILTGRGGARALTVEKQGDSYTVKEAWTNPDASTAFNTPVVKDGKVYGLSGADALFCLDAKSGKTLWTSSLSGSPQGGAGGGQGGPGGPGGRGRGGGMGRAGFGSVLDAGSVLMALTPAGELVVFKPSDSEFSPVARIKVASTPTYAHPVAADKRLLIKDQDSVALYTVE